MPKITWSNPQSLPEHSFTCGFCGKVAGPDKGYYSSSVDGAGSQKPRAIIYICSFCTQPTYFLDDQQVPGVAFGNEITALPDDVASLYREARNCMAVTSYTSAVLTCRKLLMNIAVSQKAKENQNFMEYVD